MNSEDEFWEYTNRYCLVRKQMLLQCRTRINIRAGRPFSTGKRRSEIVGLRRLNLDIEHDRAMGTNLATDQEFSQLTRIQVKQ